MSDKPQPASLFRRLLWEVRLASMFGVRDADGSVVDVQDTFAPTGPVTIALRSAFFVWNLGTLLADFYLYNEADRFIFMGYLTHWTWVICLLYQLTSLSLVTCFRSSAAQPEVVSVDGTASQPQPQPSFLIRLVWALYSVAAPSSFVVTGVYWFLVYDSEADSITYLNVMKHGISGLLVVIDGGLLSTVVPVRLKHVAFFEAYCIVYLCWNYLHSQLDIGNGSEEGEALYDILNWVEDPKAAATLSAIILLIVCPFSFVLVWALSLTSLPWGFPLDGSRRLTKSGGGIDAALVSDGDYGSIV